MARRLAAAGFAVTAWNRTPDKAARSDASGVDRCRLSCAMPRRDADVVICMLSSGQVCDAVLLRPGGVIDAMRRARRWSS